MPDIVTAQDGHQYHLLGRDSGFLHPEDKGLWHGIRVAKNARGDWYPCDDDDWMLSDDLQIVAREVGWDRKRFTPDDWGFDKYMIWGKR